MHFFAPRLRPVRTLDGMLFGHVSSSYRFLSTCHESRVTSHDDKILWILSSCINLETASSRTRIVARAGSASWPPNHCRNRMEILVCSYVCGTPGILDFGERRQPKTSNTHYFRSFWFLDWIKSLNEFDSFAQVLLHCFETSLDL